MEGYFDIHAHILPGVDDGAKDEKQSTNMLKMAYEEGVRSIIATPHFYTGREHNSVEHIIEIYEKTKRIAKEFGIQLYLGNEISYGKGILEALEKKEALTLAGSPYVLVEFFWEDSYTSIYRGLRELIEEGYFPIIAHIERNTILLENINKLQELTEMGCLMQMNTKSVIGGILDSRVRQCQKIIRKGCVHFLGSDCHNETSRPPMMNTSVEFLKKKKIPREIINKLTWENSKKIIRRVG